MKIIEKIKQICSLHAESAENDFYNKIKNFSPAWLICIGGKDNLITESCELNPVKKTKWRIGVTKYPALYVQNDIVIRDGCFDISRRHAIVTFDNGKYYLDCLPGGIFGGITVIRNEKSYRMRTRAHKPLADGDIILLGTSVYLKFTYQAPE